MVTVTRRKDVIMTDPAIPDPPKPNKGERRLIGRMRAIEAEFAACGLTTHLTDARTGLDLSAILSPSGKREAEIWVDERGYVELRYWSPPGASRPEIAATALRALRAITGAALNPAPSPLASPHQPRLARRVT
jgi:hypothetical protein